MDDFFRINGDFISSGDIFLDFNNHLDHELDDNEIDDNIIDDIIENTDLLFEGIPSLNSITTSDDNLNSSLGSFDFHLDSVNDGNQIQIDNTYEDITQMDVTNDGPNEEPNEVIDCVPNAIHFCEVETSDNEIQKQIDSQLNDIQNIEVINNTFTTQLSQTLNTNFKIQLIGDQSIDIPNTESIVENNEKNMKNMKNMKKRVSETISRGRGRPPKNRSREEELIAKREINRRSQSGCRLRRQQKENESKIRENLIAQTNTQLKEEVNALETQIHLIKNWLKTQFNFTDNEINEYVRKHMT